MEYLIVCPLCLIAGFVDSIAGGGGLISLPAFLFAGLPVHAALGTNKLQATMGTFVATVRYAANGFMVKELVAVGIVCGLAGSAVGTSLALVASDFLIKVFMLAALPFVAFYVLRTKNFDLYAENGFSLGRTAATVAVLSLAVGVYDGFYGPGTGTILMLVLTGVARTTLNVAAGTTKAVNLTTNATSMVVFLANGATLVPLGLVAGVFSIVGNWLGSRFFTEKGSAIVRPVMLVVVALFALKLIYDLAF
ncbi:MAG: TSUP family transporter [Eggerthellaceae bacterium]|nr:TSUP family transporter [Eggerthellaceae bacterium]